MKVHTVQISVARKLGVSEDRRYLLRDMLVAMGAKDAGGGGGWSG